jgi:hypothetical protein
MHAKLESAGRRRRSCCSRCERRREREKEKREEREKEQTLARESKFRVFFRV